LGLRAVPRRWCRGSRDRDTPLALRSPDHNSWRTAPPVYSPRTISLDIVHPPGRFFFCSPQRLLHILLGLPKPFLTQMEAPPADLLRLLLVLPLLARVMVGFCFLVHDSNLCIIVVSIFYVFLVSCVCYLFACVRKRGQLTGQRALLSLAISLS